MAGYALPKVYEGWEGYNRSLTGAVRELTTEQFGFRAAPGMRSVGELAWHIGDGRVDWFRRIGAPSSDELQALILARDSRPPLDYTGLDLVKWLDTTYRMIDATLVAWGVDDLDVTFEHAYQGKVYAVSRQWVIWRIMAHDIHHGGQLSELLAMQDIEPLELTLLGGHLTEPPLLT